MFLKALAILMCPTVSRDLATFKYEMLESSIPFCGLSDFIVLITEAQLIELAWLARMSFNMGWCGLAQLSCVHKADFWCV